MICFHDWKADVVLNWAGLMSKRVRTRFEEFSFGSIRIDGITYEHDVVIDQGNIRKRNKKPSKKFRDTYGHTPLSVDEDIPWKCERLVVGTGTGALPVMDEVKREARRRKIRRTRFCTSHASLLTIGRTVILSAARTISSTLLGCQQHACRNLL